MRPSLVETLKTRYKKISSEVLLEIIETFLHESSNLVAQIGRGIKEEDFSKVAQAAHTLKSSSALMGATSFSRLCEEMETMALAGDSLKAKQVGAQIQLEYSHLHASLEEEIKNST